MLRERRTFAVEELDASHRALELRTPSLRIGLHHSRNMVSDFRLVDAAAPFTHTMGRHALTLIHEAVAGVLSKLETSPAIGDLTGELGWNERLIHRRLADLARRYSLLHPNWRAMLHHARMVSALRLLAAPGATTEIVAARTGFRAASSLCHAFANAGLPSPGVLARRGRTDVLSEWADLVIAAPERIDEAG